MSFSNMLQILLLVALTTDMARMEPLDFSEPAEPVGSAESLPEPQRWQEPQSDGNRENYGYNNYGGNKI